MGLESKLFSEACFNASIVLAINTNRAQLENCNDAAQPNGILPPPPAETDDINRSLRYFNMKGKRRAERHNSKRK